MTVLQTVLLAENDVLDRALRAVLADPTDLSWDVDPYEQLREDELLAKYVPNAATA